MGKILIAGSYINELPGLEEIYGGRHVLSSISSLKEAKEILERERQDYFLVFVHDGAYYPVQAIGIIDDILSGKRREKEYPPLTPHTPTEIPKVIEEAFKDPDLDL